MSYNSKYTGAEVEALLDAANGKQDKITDLDTIRAGAAKGATALQSIPSEYVTESELEQKGYLTAVPSEYVTEGELAWTKAEGEAGVRLKGTNGTATGNQAISAGDDKTASDGTVFTSAASGDHAVVFGFGNTCAGRSTLAQGLYNTVSGKDSVAFGQRNTVNGDQAFAAGQLNEVTARLGVAIGYKNKATNTDSIAIGYQNTSGGSASVAMGDTCEANGTSSTAMGYKTKATGAYSSTFGENTQATNEGEVAMGVYNKSTTSTDASEQTSFSFGIGTSDTDRANALEIKKNGDVYIGDKSLSKVATSGSYNDLSDKPTIPAEQVNADWNATSGKAQILNKPTIPSAVTELTVSGWGFTKNTGTYSKPSGGIPKTDLASAVQTSLSKADTALQSVPNTYATNEYVDNKLATTLAFYRTRFTFQELVEAKNIGESILEGGKTELVQAITLGKTIVMDYDSMSGVEGHILVNATLEGDEILLQIVFGNEHIVVSTFNDGDTIYPDDITYDFFVAESDFNNTIGGLNANKQDTLVSGTNLKTINGQSLLGSGNITISGGGGGSGSGGGSGAYAQVNHGTRDTTFTLTPNTFHVWDEVTSLTLTLGSETSGMANEFVFQFTSGATATSLTLPDGIKWAEVGAPSIKENATYQISILNNFAVILEYATQAVLIDNYCTYSDYTLTFDYPVASEVTVEYDHMFGSDIVVFEVGQQSITVDKLIMSIYNITPSGDSVYYYCF